MKEVEIKWLLTECGMVSRSETYTHEDIRQLVAKSIYKMQPEIKEALINTLHFLLYGE